MNTYHCPISGEAFEIDADAVEWDDEGNATIDCPRLLRQVIQRSPRANAVTFHDAHSITIAKPVTVGFGGGDA